LKYHARVVRRLETGQIVGLAVLAAAIFGVGLYLFIDHAITKARETKLAEVRAETEKMQKRGGAPMLDAAAAVASQFVAHVGAGRFTDAHALLAAPFKSAVSVDAFARTCRASALLAGARAVALTRLRQQSAGGASSIEASGVLDSTAGAVPIAFVFLQEPAGLRILVVSLGGVPVLQGIAPARP
jgi:hypothetical protein